MLEIKWKMISEYQKRCSRLCYKYQKGSTCTKAATSWQI